MGPGKAKSNETLSSGCRGSNPKIARNAHRERKRIENPGLGRRMGSMKPALILSATWKALWGLAAAAMLLPAMAGAAPFPSGADTLATASGPLTIAPVNHASMALGWKEVTILIDPVGDAALYKAFPAPDLILITHAHPDHFNAKTLADLAKEKTVILAPSIVVDQLPAELKARAQRMTNGESKTLLEVKIEAIPAYNTTADHLQFHPKGVGNGYVLGFADKRVYISGDTEDIPEMRALKNIDVAFLCMNLPYTMTVDQAASAVLAFKPKIVYPYHYRGSDLDKFKALTAKDAGIEVRLRDWYKP